MTTWVAGLLIISVGLLGAIVALGIGDQRRYKVGMGLAGAIVLLGLVSLATSSIGAWWDRARAERIRQENLERLRQLEKQFRSIPSASTSTVSGFSPVSSRRR